MTTLNAPFSQSSAGVDHSRGPKVLALTSIAFFLTALDFTIVNVAFRAMAEDFGPGSRSLLPWSLSGYAIAFAAGLLTAGRMADSFGRKRWFLLGTAVFTTSSVLCGVAPTAGFLVAARVLQAIGGAMLIPSATALVMPEFPVERRSAVMGVTATIGAVAAATGPSLGGWLVTAFGWRWVFFVNVPFCVATLIFGSRLLRESRDATAKTRPDFVGAGLAVASVAALTLAIIEGESWGWTSAAEVGSLLLAGVLGVAFVARCRRHPTPVLDLSLLSLRFVTVANAATVLWSMGFYAMFFNHVAWLQDVWGYSEQRSGAAIVPGPAVAAIVGLAAGRVARRFGHKRMFAAGALLVSADIAVAVIRLDAAQPDYVGVMLPFFAVAGVGIALVISSLTAAANGFLPAHRFAMGSALYNTNRQIGAALGVAIASAIQATWPGSSGVRVTYGYVALVIAAAAVVMLTLYRRPSASELAASGG